ncbi:hypothetical protein [Colwellia sp. TT2012]|uniref:hypothetical protein n=1 Tax=Colwellia sp. TT2012 TaxID=1720342 RepID=UPI00070948A4|nr:hypothetical protein [Colwellia sp. TT2012]
MKRLILPVLLTSTLIFVAILAIGGKTGDSGQSHHMKHGQIDVSSYAKIPGLSIQVLPDAMSGWNLHVATENFRFTPENINKEPVEGEGHAHLYIDGQKISRLYGAWFHVAYLSPGSHTFRVTLNANNHSELALNGTTIAGSKKMTR